MRKEFLFKYLHAKRVEGVDPTADKSVIISHVLTLWGVNDQGGTQIARECDLSNREILLTG